MFFRKIAKAFVKIIILPFLYLIYLYSVYLMTLINTALTIYFVLMYKITGIPLVAIEYVISEEVCNFPINK